MPFEDESLSDLWTQPLLRRDARVAAAPLPSAAPIGHAATEPPVVHRGRLIAGFTAAAVIGLSATTATILTSGAGIAGVTTTVAADALDHAEAALSGGERGGPHDTGRVGAGQADADDREDAAEQAGAVDREDADEQSDAAEQANADDDVIDAPPVSEVDAQTPDADAGIVSPGAGTTDPGASTPPESGTTPPAPSAPPAPHTPAPQPPAPQPPAQEPPSSHPTPAPPAPQPSPSPSSPPATSQPAAPKPLAFTGLTENKITLLGFPLLSSYTLSLSGEPGSKASVTYGSLSAGSVRFDGSGRATLEIGSSLLGLKLSNPMIRAAYSDGTAGSAVEARRDSI